MFKRNRLIHTFNILRREEKNITKYTCNFENKKSYFLICDIENSIKNNKKIWLWYYGKGKKKRNWFRNKKEINEGNWKIKSWKLNRMPSITRSLSRYFDRENIPEKDRKEMLEAAYTLLKLSKNK